MARGRPRGRPRTRPRTPPPEPEPASASDEEMGDAAEEQADASPDAEAAATPANESDTQAAASEPSTPPTIQIIPRKKRLGRPPKNRPPDWDTPDVNDDGTSERGTPQKRKRGRPSGGGVRGRPRGGASQSTKVAIDKEGNMMDVIGDEVALPEDPEGETKVDKMGNLQGGRDYRVRVFTIMGRDDRLYMLSTEPARCTGFRDSYLFFAKHMQLHKIIIDEAEKRDLIDRDIIPHSYKGRAIGVVTARSVFREFGARIVIGGKRIIDDYYVTKAREQGAVEGEIADPNDQMPPPGEPYNKNQYVAWHGASAVYHTGVPSVPMPNGKPILGKRKPNITSANWQFEHARSSSQFNSRLAADRRLNLDGVYDPHTNTMHQPKIMQPSHVKWEELPVEAPTTFINGLPTPTSSEGDTQMLNGDPSAVPSRFASVPYAVARNFLVTDTVYKSAPLTGFGAPGPDGGFHDVGTNGLADISDDILAELAPENRKAFEEAKAQELAWKNSWRTEAEDGARGRIRVGFVGFPV